MINMGSVFINKVELLKNLYTCVVPMDKTRKSVAYDMKTSKKISEVDIVEDYEVYLVNDSDYTIGNVEMLVGGSASQDDGVLETSKQHLDLGKLDSKAALLLESLDFGMLDYMNWYDLDLHLNEKELLQISFSFNGWKVGPDTYKTLPVLNRKGTSIVFDLRNGDNVKDIVKDLDMKSKFTKTSGE
jgi:hypothetical protein